MSNIEKMLADEINSMPATDFEKIKEAYNRIQSCNLQDTKTDRYTTQKKTVPLYIKASCIAAAFAIVFLIWGYFNLIPYSYVNIDISPSIELSLNRLDKVINVRTVNDDANNITDNFKPSGNLDETIESLMQLLDENNYINENNAIVVTVQCNKSDKRQQIMLLVNQKIENYINNNDKKINVISENIDVDDTLKSEAKKKGISSVKLTIENNNNQDNLDSTKPANIVDSSNQDTITPSSNNNNIKPNNNAAISVKESNSEITTANISYTENSKNIKPVNEMTIQDNTQKNYKSDTNFNLQEELPVAVVTETVNEDKAEDNTVNIVAAEPTPESNSVNETATETTTNSEKSVNTDTKDDAEPTTKTIIEETTITNEVTETTTVIHSSGGGGSKSAISSEKAVSVACDYIGISKEDIELDKAKLNSGTYKIEFVYGNNKYEFNIDAYTGTVIKYETDKNNVNNNDNNDDKDNTIVPVTPISLEQAILNALSDADAEKENAEITKSERDDDIYNIVFLYNNCEYKYEIDIYSGEIIERKIQEQVVTISDNDALKIALDDVGANENEIQIEKLEQKNDKFKIEFIYSNNRYSFEIDSYSGDILEKEIQEHVVAISEETALSITLNDIGAYESDIQIEKLEQHGDKFKIEFVYSNCQYSYEIDAYTGEILEKEIQEQTPSISEETALLTALDDIGITESEIELKGIENKDGEFKIAFVYNGITYKYNIDAFTGEILKRKADDND